MKHLLGSHPRKLHSPATDICLVLHDRPTPVPPVHVLWYSHTAASVVVRGCQKQELRWNIQRDIQNRHITWKLSCIDPRNRYITLFIEQLSWTKNRFCVVTNWKHTVRCHFGTAVKLPLCQDLRPTSRCDYCHTVTLQYTWPVRAVGACWIKFYSISTIHHSL